MAKSPQRLKIETAIMAVVASDPGTINSNIARRVNLELGVNLSTRQIGEIRRQLGIGSAQIWHAQQHATYSAAAMVGDPNTSTLNPKILALLFAANCVRNTVIEDYHAGKVPRSQTGDFTDVTVVTPFGEIPWTKVSRISDAEMKALNIQVVDKLYTALSFLIDPLFIPDRDQFLAVLSRQFPLQWNEPKLDQSMIQAVQDFDK